MGHDLLQRLVLGRSRQFGSSFSAGEIDGGASLTPLLAERTLKFQVGEMFLWSFAHSMSDKTLARRHTGAMRSFFLERCPHGHHLNEKDS